MKTPDDKEDFVARLLAQDPPPPDELQQNRDLLFRAIRRRVLLSKLTVGAVYLVCFLAAFGAYMQQRRTDDTVRALLWGSLSSYILLWFLVWCLRENYRNLAQLLCTGAAEEREWKRQDLFITALAVVVFAVRGVALYRWFSLPDPQPIARKAMGVVWSSVFFLFWYMFSTASLVAKLWIKHQKLRLRHSETEGRNASS
jgi:hypothetical protein